jgi:succinate dehydrogenase/fumarate reductase flavoprotein subunit
VLGHARLQSPRRQTRSPNGRRRHIVGDFVADFCAEAANDVRIPDRLVREFVAAEQASLTAWSSGADGERTLRALRAAMQNVMTRQGRIFRPARLASAVDDLQACSSAARASACATGGQAPTRARRRPIECRRC